MLRELRQAARGFVLSSTTWIDAMPFDPKCRDDGEYDKDAARIRIRLYRVGRERQAIKLSSAMAALAHEIAHILVWRHGKRHQQVTKTYATLLRERGFPVAHKIHANTGERKTKYGRL